MHSLDANLALPRLLEPAGRLLLPGSRALPSLALLAELLAEELLVLAGEEGEEPAVRWRRMGRAARRMLLVGAMACEIYSRN